jgi:hypothetical protein
MSWSEKETQALKLGGITSEFIGTPKGVCESAPTFVEWYLAGAYGRLAKYRRSTLKVGQRFTHKGRDYIVTYNNTTRGNVHIPSLHRFAAVPA